MRKVVATFALGLVLGLTALPVVSQVSYPVALWPVADAANANRLVREVLFAARTYYVRTDGHDTNCDGKTDASDASTSTTACAFLTIQRAVNVVYGTLDVSTYAVTIQVKDGTYTGAVAIAAPHLGTGAVTIQGNSGTPSNVLISTTSADAFYVSGGAIVTVKDLKITTTTSGTAVSADTKASVYLSNIDFGAAATYHMLADQQSSIRITGSYTISGNAQIHWAAVRASTIWVTAGLTVTTSGTPAFSIFTAYASATANLQLVSLTFAGTGATGTRYSATLNGTINTNGGGASYLPGNASGSTATGGQYV